MTSDTTSSSLAATVVISPVAEFALVAGLSGPPHAAPGILLPSCGRIPARCRRVCGRLRVDDSRSAQLTPLHAHSIVQIRTRRLRQNVH